MKAVGDGGACSIIGGGVVSRIGLPSAHLSLAPAQQHVQESNRVLCRADAGHYGDLNCVEIGAWPVVVESISRRAPVKEIVVWLGGGRARWRHGAASFGENHLAASAISALPQRKPAFASSAAIVHNLQRAAPYLQIAAARVATIGCGAAAIC